MDTKQGTATRPKSRVGIAERTTAAGVVHYRGTAFDKGTRSSSAVRGRHRSPRRSPGASTRWPRSPGAPSRGPRAAAEGGSGRLVAPAKAGKILNRDGQEYKPGLVRGLEQSFRLRIVPTLGAGTKIGDVRRSDVRRAVDRWRGEHLSPSAVRNTLNALRALCRHAERRGEIHVNPCIGIDLPRVRGARDRVASPSEGLRLVMALETTDHAIYGTALFAGLRLGELRALRWREVDLNEGVIYERRSWDPREGAAAPKSDAGIRTVPIVKTFRAVLAHHRRSCEWAEDLDGLALGRTPTQPFSDTGLRGRAVRRWEAARLSPIGLHESRHTAASWFIAAGVNLKAVSTILGHSSIIITLDRYGCLLPGAEVEAADLIEAYLTRRRQISPATNPRAPQTPCARGLRRKTASRKLL